ncbi:MAG: beta-N-acetylglucosaminidase domain-containing protein [Bacteroidales bacterium]|nr:beta-N-acetylglucosaminidase domain-containing protein [Bacteroidales bacterium]MDY4459838.1 beta-N-acetylglucosaminidase domain-containing protein [Alloprevotella sp.]
MKKTLFSVAALLLGGCLSMQAQVSLVNPVPHQVERQAGAAVVKAPKAWAITADAGRHQDVVRLLQQAEGAKAGGAKATFKLTIGVKGDKAVRKYAKKIPAKAEGYYLEVTPKGAVLAAADEVGLFWAAQTWMAMLSEGKMEYCTITDYPDVPYRGVVEGFYGTPWSHQARLSQIAFYARHKMNVYIYGPKDDPWHRDKWREPYPEAEAKRISELATYARSLGVNFYWAIHPGVDIKWTEQDRDYLVAKLEKMYDLGVRSFAVFFDDIWGEGTRADKQAELLNYVDNNFIQKKHDVAPLIMCPTEYNRAWANDEKGYLRTLGTQMNQGIEIMWTGNSVVHCIDRESQEWINQRINRKSYIWWNFPVSDFVRDHILLGPAYGNDLDIAETMSGFVSNPMEHAEASKISLYGIADYTWNMPAYDYQADWEKGLREVLPSNYEALRTFALYNKDLGPNGHGFRREEGDELKDIAQQALAGQSSARQALALKCEELGIAVDLLLNDDSNPELLRELRPWLLQGKNVAAYGQAVVSLAEAATKTQKGTGLRSFENYYQQARSLQKQMYDLENSSVRHALQPGIKVATKVLMPTLNELFAKAVNQYNANNGTDLNPVAEYNPFRLTSNVQQLALLPVTAKGNDVNVTPALEVINWQAGGEMVIEGDRPITFAGMDFNLGVPGAAKHFTLECLVNGNWVKVPLLHYSDNDPVIHTGNELGGMTATKLRLTNTSGAEQKVYFRHFKFVKQ